MVSAWPATVRRSTKRSAPLRMTARQEAAPPVTSTMNTPRRGAPAADADSAGSSTRCTVRVICDHLPPAAVAASS